VNNALALVEANNMPALSHTPNLPSAELNHPGLQCPKALEMKYLVIVLVSSTVYLRHISSATAPRNPDNAPHQSKTPRNPDEAPSDDES
jgi:hypothetical protein